MNPPVSPAKTAKWSTPRASSAALTLLCTRMVTEPTKPTSPHDALFRAVFGSPTHMAEELAVVLPEELRSSLDLASLTPEPGSFIDANLVGAETDLLFSASAAAGKALVYVLVEHQSSPDRHMPLRLLRYVGRILDARRRRAPDDDTLPPVVPVVLYHAERPWPYPLDMGSLYSVPVLGQLDASPPPDEQRAALFAYTWAVGRVEVSEMGDFVRKHTWPNLESSVMTTAEKLEAKGMTAGLARTLLKQLRLRFGAVSPRIEQRIEAASLAELDVWLERVVSAQSAEDVIER